MNSCEPTANAKFDRRKFLRGGLFLGFSLMSGLLGRALVATGQPLNFYERAMLRRNLGGPPIKVYKMVPLSGRHYSPTDLRHMTNKIFPSIDAARARRQHKAFFYGLREIHLPRPLVNGMDHYTLFCGRKDWDVRGPIDARHWRRLGINISTARNVIRNA